MIGKYGNLNQVYMCPYILNNHLNATVNISDLVWHKLIMKPQFLKPTLGESNIIVLQLTNFSHFKLHVNRGKKSNH